MGNCCGGKSKQDTAIKDKDLKKFIRDAVHAHNKHRKVHDAPALKHNKQLSKIAQQWANNLASSGKFEHSNNELKGEKLGENIANKWSSKGAEYTGQEVVDQWYSEEPRYDYSGTSRTLSAGHFTQVVWAGSKEVGIGKAKSKDGKVYVVANYKPPGNVIGRFKDNVNKPNK